MRAEGQTTCDQVLERLVAATERGGAPQDPADAEHARSCMSCFRAMTELRDVPRLAEALREAAPAPEPGERFWDALAERAADAVVDRLREPSEGSRALPRRTPLGEAQLRPRDRLREPSEGSRAVPRRTPLGEAQLRPRDRALGRLRARVVSIGALAVAAAAGLVMVARHPAPPVGQPAAVAARGAEAARAGVDDAGNETLAEVGDLDTGALRRLLDRLRDKTPASFDAPSADDGADVPVDDEARVSDALAELDGDGLRRVASSLEASAL